MKSIRTVAKHHGIAAAQRVLTEARAQFRDLGIAETIPPVEPLQPTDDRVPPTADFDGVHA